jgi:hypothetical protein
MKLVIVGQNPARRMSPGAEPFDSVSSYKRLADWMTYLTDGNTNQILLYNASDKPGKVGMKDVNPASLYQINAAASVGYKVIALGNYASKALDKMDIDHFKLHHPSGRCRLNNNKEYVDNKLKECYDWLRPLKFTTSKVITDGIKGDINEAGTKVESKTTEFFNDVYNELKKE